MKKRIWALTGLLCLACSLGNVRAENRTIDNFNAISVCCGIDVYISVGEASTLTVETNYEEYLSQIKTEVTRGTLKISFNTKGLTKRPKDMWVRVSLSANNLSEITATSGSDVYSKTPLQADNIKVTVNSGADIKLELHASNLKCSASSGSDLKLTGSAATAVVSASSGSDIQMKGMTVKVAEASASSGSGINMYVTEEISAKASSGADVSVKGNPKIVSKKKSLGGDVRVN